MGLIRCLLYAAFIGILSFFLGRLLPGSLFQENHIPFKIWSWERGGKLYDTLFHIKKWQAKVPDMSKILPGFLPRKEVTKDFRKQLPRMITETCIAEWIHGLLCILSIPCLLLWPGWGGMIFTLLYILGNIPFMMIQRYNRPRLMALNRKMEQRQQRKEL